jgi:hypothetical protein
VTIMQCALIFDQFFPTKVAKSDFGHF